MSANWQLIFSVEQLIEKAVSNCMWLLERERTDIDVEKELFGIFGNNKYLSYQHEIALERVLDEGLEVLEETIQEVWNNLS